MNNSDMPAMPVFTSDYGYIDGKALGLTKREHFAAMAMQGLSDRCFTGGKTDIGQVAKVSVMLADALLKALETNNED